MSTSPTSFKQINSSILQQIAGQTAFGTVKAEMGVAKGSHGEGGGRVCIPFYRMDTLSSAQM